MTARPEISVADRLYHLLPVVYRLRDAENGQVLRELVGVLAGQVEVLAEEIDQLYDDQFIETCAEWVAPYVGDVIGYRVLHGEVSEVASPRAEVANTIGYRRRKGTASVLEQLAHDVTGWPARAVEFFERLVTTQYMNHPRPLSLATVDFRDHESLSWIRQQNGAFDDLRHTGDVRRINANAPATRGRHNIANIGIFLWRIEAQRLARTPLAKHAADGRRFRFDVLGADAPLFAAPRTETEITHLAEPYDVPMPLGRRWLAEHLASYYASRLSIALETQVGAAEPEPVERDRIRVCDLSDVSGGADWAHAPTGTDVAIDPVLGRVYFGTALGADRALATYHQGIAVPVGAGTRTRLETDQPTPKLTVGGGQNIQAALDSIAAGGTLEIGDSDRYGQVFTVKATAAAAGQPDTAVHVVAAEAARPFLDATGAVKLNLGPRTSVVLDGLLIAGGPLVIDEVGDAETRTVTLRNCTLVPGQERTPDGHPKQPDRASLLVLDPFAVVVVERCVLGPIVAVEGSQVTVRDSALDASTPDAVAYGGRAASGGPRTAQTVSDQVVGDGTTAGGGLDLHESTVIGGIHCTQLDASNSLLVARLPLGDPRLAAIHARRRQVGCVRFSYLPEGSRTGTKYRCQPDPKDPPETQNAATPRFTSLLFGDPAYLQLAAQTPDAIRRGADDESEMGVTHLIFGPQRESNLLLRLDEYLRFGLEAGFFYAT